MSRELPLYQGATPQAPQQQMQGPGFTPRVQPMGGMLEAAVQAGFGTVEQYAELKDFGESQQVEHQRRLNDQQMREEFESKMQLPWGAEGGFYDSEGNRKEDEVKAFIGKWQEKNNKIPRPFWLVKNDLRDEGDLMQANDALDARVNLMTLDAEAKNRKQAFLDNYDLAVKQKDWTGAHRVIDRAIEAGQITRARGDEMRLKVDKTSFSLQFADLSATNPDLAAEMINRGELDRYFSAAEQDDLMRSLRRQDDSRLTELIEQMASRPKTKNDKQAVTDTLMSGPVYKDQLEFDAVHQRDGDYSACAPQIDSFIYQVADQVKAGDEGADFASKKEEVIRLCKFYGKSSEFQKDILNRMDKWAGRKNEYPVLKVSERMREIAEMPLYRQADYNQAIGTLHSEAAGAYGLYLDSAKGAGMDAKGKDDWLQEYKSKKVAELEKNLAAKTELAVRERFEAWYEGYKSIHNDKEPSSVIQEEQFQTLLREVTGRSDLVVPKRGNVMDAEQKKASTLWKMGDDERLKAGPELLSEGEKQALRRKEVLRKPVTFPAMVSVDTVNTNAPAGILLPESMRKQFGDDVSGLAALVPSSPSSRRGKPLPVVGYTKESSPQLTLSGASKLRMTFSSKMDTNVTVSPASPQMKEFFKKEYPGSQDWKQGAGESKVPAAKLGGLGQYSQAFYDAGRKYGVDPKLLMAIAMHETGKGTSAAFLSKNNAMGISPDGGGPRAFSSVEESIDYAARLLKKHYLDKGLTTIAAIGGKYAPAGAGNDPRGLNKHWVSGVSKYYKSF
ncbi:glucosaminidase domain-containing protein [Akkermansia sp.]|uniref:glucosaminidase domain-containing protein n=1 Tax=Akkermansia sp. TaxID=1872421 RepID=UPI0025BCE313|nr:glucosaminidase domain-containing protein [Akkermansia sp.]MCD8063465.1 glucosaminidase domain-containing protein [Akkermansia sp.]